ncbi:hypothetical protein HPC38_01555 [Pasteurellaceae bacterium HPA106]|uniref:hypothetical protein n=1 Tax=Spirabiliibacterium pneumoniae TaxID=221400 RepID=UPI001AADCB18|nr:hypothetical protein [Spirabiliibacterium pneumoniae]MBE2895561.1 hypothetical protein [Spirabiliibacterium pneumoniae]
MANNVFLALYKGHKTGKSPKALMMRLSDWLTRKLTKGQYSHCEIAVLRDDGQYCCRSSSIRDGGVRQKVMPLDMEKWDLIPLAMNEERVLQIVQFYYRQQGKKYDWWGALGVVLKCRQNPEKYFCSEFCAQALGLNEPWRFSPNDLAAIIPSIQ